MSQRERERARTRKRERERNKIHARSRAYVSLPMIKRICIIKHNSTRCDELANCISFCESLRYTHKRARMCVYPRVYNPSYTCTENTPPATISLTVSTRLLQMSLSLYLSVLSLSLSLSPSLSVRTRNIHHNTRTVALIYIGLRERGDECSRLSFLRVVRIDW